MVLLFVFSLSASSQDDPQPVPHQRFGGHFPGEALEKRGQSLRLRLLLRGAGARLRAGERSAGDPHASPLPHQRAQAPDLLCGRHTERGAAALRHRVLAQSCGHLPGWVNFLFFLETYIFLVI